MMILTMQGGGVCQEKGKSLRNMTILRKLL